MTYPKLLMEFPHRNPIQLVECIKDVIQDKVVCDPGCGSGDLLEYAKMLDAKDVVGVEILKDRVLCAHSHGRNYVIFGDLTKMKIPEADIYLLWTYKEVMQDLIKNIPSGKTVICCENIPDMFKQNKELEFVETRYYNFDERKLCKKRHGKWIYHGKRCVTIYKRL